MKKIAFLAVAAMAAGIVTAGPAVRGAVTGGSAARGSRTAGASIGRGQPAAAAAAADGLRGKVMIDRYPRLGSSCLLSAPSLQGGSSIGQCYTKPRQWIVLETKYTTTPKTIDRLIFTWHVVLDTSKSTNKDKEGRAKLAPYSYFTQTTTYVNIPQGSHAASVCLHPSYLETFGEPVAVTVLVSDSEGTILSGDTVTTMEKFFKKTKGHKFWEDSEIMNAKQGGGEPMIEQRQGLQERSKTIWALVNPNDYEMVAQ